MASAMELIPGEILINILAYVEGSPHGSSDLIQCLQVCKRWHEIGSSILYRNIVVGTDRMPKFRKRFNFQMADRVRSLTIKLGGDLPSETVRFVVAARLLCFQNVLPKLQRLRSFSLRLIPRDSQRFEVSDQPISKLLRQLPLSCVDLEISTTMRERFGLGDLWNKPRFYHLCNVIRSLLPRMHHNEDSLNQQRMALVSGKPMSEQIACQPEGYAPSVNIVAISLADKSYISADNYQTIIRADMLSRTQPLMQVAEGEFWRTLEGGARLPSARVWDPDAPEESSGLLLNEATCRAVHPNHATAFWQEEEEAGTILLDADTETDPSTYLKLDPLKMKKVKKK
ncbi:hypothetical protein GGS23DRAFT_597352 [Durotheca rogersii]|uniref:uncharacterized protein n=1 Tax=Durotheca rogersii TaxID=419775 RepID=UPI00221FF3BB|nr:uncharacterized protein GGS23DRAFT_597352 [Durotheca rogersii]KAI5862554.1 hypothetical protein GGS23DRAFT_597352 [Durotheca rogersii]